MAAQNKQDVDARRKRAIKIAVITALADGVALGIGVGMVTPEVKTMMILSIAAVGIITFLGVLTLANELSADPDLSKGEVRKAIAASFIAVYFVTVPFLILNPDVSGSLAQTVITDFTAIIITIIGFYFGFRGMKEIMLTHKGK